MYARPGVEKNEQMHSSDKLIELYPKLSRYCQFLSQNKWDGEDLAQETILKAIGHYENKTDMNSALLNKIAHNTWIDSVRKHSKETISEIPENVEDNVNPRTSYDWIEKFFNTLTMKQATIFTLKEAFQYKLSEIAEALDMSETAVKSVLNRARRRLEKLVDAEHENFTPQIVPDSNEEQIRTILYEALQTEDPSRLLRIASDILKVASDQPKMILQTRKIRSTSSPSSHLSMAA
ncbi:sigma-70 family RNA polymerase sigma factor [Alkalihalobacillus sp. AL-G]|uniref:sigma-70 family RNA polymerase sigma factor n=1 Tax=Alkalihalobacillus sp. AL-G TaxID=2926399 RepID=UPI00272DA710|nr:sigma-70 family RNA polymerase sigma factor [Alkalihalobacillus sp. AL-G]WLD94346.1 sigma-70 family RNA polymerase sigma factor [Alkalihalobacillus sp. AL-G]